ncbi:MAG: hypothetical protein PHF30_01585 [Bacilli bacterium]|nr:hypothetical protein [Bacilli bacterium]
MQEIKEIIVNLKVNNSDKDILEFCFEKPLEIKLNEEKSDSMEKVFSKLLEILIKEKVELKLRIESNYSKRLFIDVITAYIDDLNKEIKKIKFE